MIRRRLLGLLLALAVLVPVVTVFSAAPASAVPQAAAQQQAISREDAIRQLAMVRASIDQTLELVKQGNIEQAYTQARTGYLDHFEYVEVPLRVVAPDLTADAETKFAEIRGLIKSGAPVDAVRTNIIELRRLIDDTERRLTDTGFDAVAVVVDDGARRALCAEHRSLLPAGVRDVVGRFDDDDAVEVVGDDGAAFAKGLVRYDSATLRRVAGRRTGDLPEGAPHEVIHRDDLVVLA